MRSEAADRDADAPAGRVRHATRIERPMNENEIGRIAAAVNQLRPDWPAASLRTLLARPEITNRPRRDVACALTWVACESDTKTPARVLENGPWWHQGGETKVREPFDPRAVCHICNATTARHDDTDHPFLSVEAKRAVPSLPAPAVVREAIADTPRSWPERTTTEESA